MERSFKRIYGYDNGKKVNKYFVDGKEVSKSEYLDSLYKWENRKNDEITSELTTTKDGSYATDSPAHTLVTKDDKNYYTSREFNIFETVEFLSNNPDWKAKRGNAYYIYDKDDKIFAVDDKDKTRVVINTETLNWKFKLIPPIEEKWIDCNAEEAIKMFDKGYKIRSLTKDYKIRNVFCPFENMDFEKLYYDIVNDCRWQYLDE